LAATRYAEWRKQTQGFASLAAYHRVEASVGTQAHETSRVILARASGNLFETLGIHPIAGRLLRSSDEGVTPCAAVLTQRYALRAFGGHASALDRALTVEGQSCYVVGVVADRYAFPTVDVDLFTPLSTGVMFTKDARGRMIVGIAQVHVIGQPRPDIHRDVLVAEGSRYFDAPVNIVSFNDMLTASYRRTLEVLWLCSLLVLVVAVFNVTAVMATHALTRVREWGVKGALGASRGALWRETIRESSVVCVTGAAMGFALALESLYVLSRHGPEELAETTVSWEIWLLWLIVTVILIAVTSLPAWWQASRLSRFWSPAVGGLGAGDRTPAVTTLGPLLLVSQLACGVGLVSVTLLFATTLRETFFVTRGFDADGVVIIPTYWNGSEEANAYVERVQTARGSLLATQPGVEVAVASDVPVPIVQRAFSMSVEDETRGVVMHGDLGSARITAVGPGYFRVMGIPLLVGREFTRQDGVGTTPTVVVSSALAAQWFGSTAAALGQSIQVSGLEGSAVIVGVAHDVRRSVWDAKELPVIYLQFAQVSHRPGSSSSDRNLILLVKRGLSAGHQGLSPDSLQQAIQRSVPGLQVGPARSVRSARIQEVQQIAAYVGVSTVFAAVTVLLVALGVFAATSHLVARRTREIAIRQAVGATAAQARRPVATTLVKWWLGAVMGGILVSGAGAKIVDAWQAGLVPMTVANLTWSVMVITTALIIAAWAPLRHAGRVPPALLMRAE